MIFRCPACREKYDLDIALGQKVECDCGNRFWVSEDELVNDTDTPAGDEIQKRVFKVARPVAIKGGTRSGSQPPQTHARYQQASGTWIGRELGHSRILEKVGQGSMGEVYLGRHTTLDIPVAVKILNQSSVNDKTFIRRFLQEAQTAAEMNHPNVTRIFDCGTSPEGVPYIVMEYMSHGSVEDLLQQHKQLSVHTVLKVANDMALALLEAEQRGIVHRDIKPANIMCAGNDVYKLVDLGLARKIHDSKSTLTSQLTKTQFGLGTPLYLPPEQATSASSVDHRADIYSLGATMFHLLAGQPPFKASNLVQLLQMHARMPVPDLTKFNHQVTPQVFTVIKRCMAKTPDFRYQSTTDLLHDLGVLMRNPAPRESLLRAYEMDWDRKNNIPDKILIGMIGTLVFLLIAVAGLCVLHVAQKKQHETLPITALPGTRLPSTLRAPEYNALLAALQQESTNPQKRGMLWAEACIVAARAGDHNTAFFSLRETFLALQQQAADTRDPVPFNRAVVAFLQISNIPAEELQDYMSEIRRQARLVMNVEQMLVTADMLDFCRNQLGLRGALSPLPDYRIAIEYNFILNGEITDFYLPRVGWTRTAEGWHDQEDGWQLKNNRLTAGPNSNSRILWKVPHGKFMEIFLDLDLPPMTNQNSDWGLLLGVPGAALQFPFPGEKSFKVNETRSTNECLVAAEERVLGRFRTTPPRQRKRRLRIAMTLPSINIRLDDMAAINIDFPGVQSGNQQMFIGFFADPGVSIRRLRLVLSAEELAATAVSRLNLYSFPAMLAGRGRLDLPSSVAVDSLEILDPHERLISQPLTLRRALAGVNGEFTSFKSSTSLSPGVLARFAVERRAVPEKTQLRVCCFSQFFNADGQEVQSELELFDPGNGQWLKFNRAGSPFSVETQGTFSEFFISLDDARRFLSPYGEFIVRHLAPDTGGGEVKVNHMLLYAHWPPPDK